MPKHHVEESVKKNAESITQVLADPELREEWPKELVVQACKEVLPEMELSSDEVYEILETDPHDEPNEDRRKWLENVHANLWEAMERLQRGSPKETSPETNLQTLQDSLRDEGSKQAAPETNLQGLQDPTGRDPAAQQEEEPALKAYPKTMQDRIREEGVKQAASEASLQTLQDFLWDEGPEQAALDTTLQEQLGFKGKGPAAPQGEMATSETNLQILQVSKGGELVAPQDETELETAALMKLSPGKPVAVKGGLMFKNEVFKDVNELLDSFQLMIRRERDAEQAYRLGVEGGMVLDAWQSQNEEIASRFMKIVSLVPGFEEKRQEDAEMWDNLEAVAKKAESNRKTAENSWKAVRAAWGEEVLKRLKDVSGGQRHASNCGQLARKYPKWADARTVINEATVLRLKVATHKGKNMRQPVGVDFVGALKRPTLTGKTIDQKVLEKYELGLDACGLVAPFDVESVIRRQGPIIAPLGNREIQALLKTKLQTLQDSSESGPSSRTRAKRTVADMEGEEKESEEEESEEEDEEEEVPDPRPKKKKKVTKKTAEDPPVGEKGPAKEKRSCECRGRLHETTVQILNNEQGIPLRLALQVLQMDGALLKAGEFCAAHVERLRSAIGLKRATYEIHCRRLDYIQKFLQGFQHMKKDAISWRWFTDGVAPKRGTTEDDIYPFRVDPEVYPSHLDVTISLESITEAFKARINGFGDQKLTLDEGPLIIHNLLHRYARKSAETGDSLLDLFRLEAKVYEIHSRRTNDPREFMLQSLQHSIGQQVMRQDLLLYVLHAAMMGQVNLVVYPEPAYYALAGMDYHRMRLHGHPNMDNSDHPFSYLFLTEDSRPNGLMTLPLDAEISGRVAEGKLTKQGWDLLEFLNCVGPQQQCDMPGERANAILGLKTKHWEPTRLSAGSLLMCSPAHPLLRPGPVEKDVLAYLLTYMPLDRRGALPKTFPLKLATVEQHLTSHTASTVTGAGGEDREREILRPFPAAVRVPLVGAIAEALHGKIGWSTPAVVLELIKLFGMSRSSFHELVDAYDAKLQAAAREQFENFKMYEKFIFEDRSAFKAIERGDGKEDIDTSHDVEKALYEALTERADFEKSEEEDEDDSAAGDTEDKGGDEAKGDESGKGDSPRKQVHFDE